MIPRRNLVRWAVAGTFAAVSLAATGPQAADTKTPSVAPDSRLFEMRTYHAAPGKLQELHARFRDHTNALFRKHGMTIVGFWVPADKEKDADNTLVYILAHPSREASEKA